MFFLITIERKSKILRPRGASPTSGKNKSEIGHRHYALEHGISIRREHQSWQRKVKSAPSACNAIVSKEHCLFDNKRTRLGKRRTIYWNHKTGNTKKEEKSCQCCCPLRIVELKHNHVDERNKHAARQSRDGPHSKNRYARVVGWANFIKLKIT